MRRPTATAQAQKTGEKKTQLCFRVPATLHRRWKNRAHKAGQSLALWITETVERKEKNR